MLFCFYDTTFAIQRFPLGSAVGSVFWEAFTRETNFLYHQGHFNLRVLQGCPLEEGTVGGKLRCDSFA